MRIGVFGGSFDPPHFGHFVVGADAHRSLGLDRLLLVPAAVPPHKQALPRTAGPLRAAMLRAAVRNDPRFAVDDTELRRGGTSYTVDTLRELAARHRRAELFLLIGADNLRDFASWREPREIVRLARLVVLDRAGEHGDPSASVPALRLPVTRVDISSTEIRRRSRAGESTRYLVPEAVRRIIEREGLYRTSSSDSE